MGSNHAESDGNFQNLHWPKVFQKSTVLHFQRLHRPLFFSGGRGVVLYKEGVLHEVAYSTLECEVRYSMNPKSQNPSW